MWLGGGLLVALAVVAVLVAVALHRAEPFLQARIVQALQEHFHARVELDSFHASLVEGVVAEGKGLRIWPPGHGIGGTEQGTAELGEPLIRLDEFRFHAPLRYKPGEPIHIQVLELKGMDIRIPPRQQSTRTAQGGKAAGGKDGSAAPQTNAQAGSAAPKGKLLSFVVDTVQCDGANLTMETSKPGKLPLQFAIAHLKLTSVTTGGPMGFDAELTNPRPVGKIHSTGSFGPWVMGDPGESAVKGDYRFEHADLGGFKGIAGILNSTGHYEGTLRDIVVDGETDVPDFRLTHFGNAMPLHTHFHAKVDGTNGDTWLDPVDAMLGHSHFTTRGQVVRATETSGGMLRQTGHDIALDIDVDRARIEDFLRLASSPKQTTPLLTGAVTVKAALHIPPGAAPIHERMNLTGKFNLDQARFASAKIQDRIEELSLRGQGRPKDVKAADPSSVLSQMQGAFTMANGAITLPSLEYKVPGADIQLSGAYGLEGGTLNFTGAAKMDATVSQMVGGWKGTLLKPADRFFKRDGAGTWVPIHIRGTRESPDFGVDLNRLKTTSPATPGKAQP
jgi:hypothetical protein